MAKLNPYSILFNAAGALIALAIGSYVVRDLLTTEETPPCSNRYPAPSRFALESEGGVPLSGIELQARAGARERGVLEHARAVRLAGAPAPTLLEVKLGRGERVSGSVEPSGVAMTWTPPDLSGAASACLSYSVWFPEDFPFGLAGTLPGIAGGEAAELSATGKRTAFAERPMWREAGKGELLVELPSTPSGRGISLDRGKFALERGRWVRLDQEVVLNTPGKADGALRLWVDGALKSENTAVLWREDAATLVTGVVAEVHYGTPDRAPPSHAETVVRFTPFELRWK